MSKVGMALIVATILICGGGYSSGGDVKATLTTPASAQFGDLIVATASIVGNGTTPPKYTWAVLENGQKKSVIVWPDGTKIIWAAGTSPTKYQVIVGASYLSGTEVVTTDLIINEVTINSGPSPATFPQGKYGLAVFANTLITKSGLTQDEKIALGSKLASSYDGMASKISAVSTYTDIDTILRDTHSSNAAAIKASGVDPGKLMGIKTAIGDKIYDLLYTSKTITNATDMATAWHEFAIGFGGVK